MIYVKSVTSLNFTNKKLINVWQFESKDEIKPFMKYHLKQLGFATTCTYYVISKDEYNRHKALYN